MLSFYLFRSFRRRPLRHLALMWILLCAFLLPLVVSIYRDSLVHGVELQNFDFHRGQAFHIAGAQPEDTQWFQNIDGLTEPFFEDGVVYLTFDSEEARMQYEDIHAGIELDVLLRTRARQSSRRLEVLRYDVTMDSLNDPYMRQTLGRMQLTNLALLLFSGLIVQAACRSHLASFARELEDIANLGATHGQLRGMFLLELLVIFPPAAAGAVGISYGVMRLLYERFLGNTAASVAIWQVFHMDFQNTALQIGFYLLVCLAAMGFSLTRKQKPLRIGKPRKASLPRLWIERTRAPFAACLAILVPLVAAFVILFNQYLGTYADSVYRAQEAQILVGTFAIRGFSRSEVRELARIPGVEKIETTWDYSEPFELWIPDYGPALVKLHPEEGLEENQFLADFPASMEHDSGYTLRRAFAAGTPVEVTLHHRVEPEGDGDLLNVYVGEEVMEAIAEADGYTRLIVHTAAQRAGQVEAALREVLGASANISNFQNYADTTLAQQEGKLWLLSWMFGILMAAAMQIVWARLSQYVRECAPMLRIVRQVGASKKQLIRLIPVWVGAVPGVVLPFLIALPWARADAAQNSRPFIFSLPVAAIYLAIAVVAGLTFWLPVKVTLGKILTQEEAQNGAV